MIQDKMLKPVELGFQGRAGEYFRIWIVNILLSILSLGIYSAWAKVRNKQYFYGNTILDGSPFEYNASPVAILKGRLVVVAILVMYSVTKYFYPLAEGIFLILFFLVLPWLVMRSMMFNARYSSYRNLNFSFNNNLSDSVKTFIGLGLLIPLTLGLIYPYYMHAIQKYRVNNHGYGQYIFRLKSVVKAFYKYYLLALLILFAVMFIAGLLTSLIFGASIGVLLGSGEPGTQPGLNPGTVLSIFMMLGFYLIAYLVAAAYVKARTFNAVWSNTSLEKAARPMFNTPDVPLMAFKGSLEFNKMFYIYFTNTIGIILSVGLLIPWAKVRLAKYRIENLHVASLADLKVITAQQQDQVGTIGSEMGDILDIEIGM